VRIVSRGQREHKEVASNSQAIASATILSSRKSFVDIVVLGGHCHVKDDGIESLRWQLKRKGTWCRSTLHGAHQYLCAGLRMVNAQTWATAATPWCEAPRCPMYLCAVLSTRFHTGKQQRRELSRHAPNSGTDLQNEPSVGPNLHRTTGHIQNISKLHDPSDWDLISASETVALTSVKPKGRGQVGPTQAARSPDHRADMSDRMIDG